MGMWWFLVVGASVLANRQHADDDDGGGAAGGATSSHRRSRSVADGCEHGGALYAALSGGDDESVARPAKTPPAPLSAMAGPAASPAAAPLRLPPPTSGLAAGQRIARGVYVGLNSATWAATALTAVLTVWCAIENHPQTIWPSLAPAEK